MRKKLMVLLLSGLMILEPCSFVFAEDFTDGESSSVEEVFSSDIEDDLTQEIQNNDSYIGKSVETENGSVVVNKTESWSDKTINGDLFILQDCTLSVEGNVTVTGNIYVWGTLINDGYLTVTNALNCLWVKYGGMIFSAGGEYSYGKVYFNSGGRFGKLNVTSNWLNTSIPDIGQTNPCKNGHTWDNGQIQLDATCTTEGYKIYTCTICSETKQEVIPALGHRWNKKYTIDRDATCVQTGKKSIHCSVCNIIKLDSKQEIPALGHKWNSYYTIDRDATCVQTGKKSIYCSVCGEVKPNSEETIPCAEHVWDKGYVNVDATCISDGQKVLTCNNCGETCIKIISKTGHKWNSYYTIDRDATCVQTGKKSIHCSVCGEVKKQSIKVIPKTGHTWDNGEIVKKATCTGKGEEIITCTICEATKKKRIPALGHFKVIKPGVPATYTSTGKTESVYCSRCKKCIIKADVIPKLTYCATSNY